MRSATGPHAPAGRRRASGGVLLCLIVLCLALLVGACAGPAGSGVASGGASGASEPPEALASVAVGQTSTAPEAALDKALSAFADGYALRRGGHGR